MNSILITLAVLTVAAADPAVLISNRVLTPSAAYVASPPLVTSVSAVAPLSPVASVPLSSVPLSSVSSVGALPYTAVSDYRYSYGSALNYQDYAPVAVSAASLPYSLPYGYAADWYYRK